MKKFLKIVAVSVSVSAALLFAGCTEEPTTELSEDDLVRLVTEEFSVTGLDDPQSVACPEPLNKIEGEIVDCEVVNADGDEYSVSVLARSVDGDDIWVSIGEVK